MSGNEKHGPVFKNGEYVRQRRKSRKREERGLPDLEARLALAEVYLECQNRLWPQLVSTGAILANTLKNVKRLAEDFHSRFLGKAVPHSADEIQQVLAAAYVRFSDESSNPRSLAQQLKLILERAASNKHFIPWKNVFADAAVTATSAFRRNYILAKECLSDDSVNVEVLYIDEIGRASRDAIEALTLGKLVNELKKRIIGVSDGFDSSHPLGAMQLHLFAMLQEWFVVQLRSKVYRGMDDAFDQGNNTGLPAIGLKLVPKSDSTGNQVIGRHGKAIHVLAIAESEAKLVRRAFALYTERNWSPERIGKLFNRLHAGGSTKWDGSRIRQLLRRRVYIGIMIRGMTRQVRDSLSGKVTVIRCPRKEWRVRRQRELQIVPFALWKATQKRMKLAGAAWKKSREGVSRTEIYPTKLIRPICYKCKAPMQLGRSGKYSSYCCPNGSNGKNDCDFRGYKTVGIVEASILREISSRVLTEDTFTTLVAEANSFLAKLANEPKLDLGPDREKLKEVEKELKNLYKFIKSVGMENVPGAEREAKSLESTKTELRNSIARQAAKNVPPPPPITRAAVEFHLSNLRDLLNQDVAKAAPRLKALTGPIEVRPTGEKRGNRKLWEASFTVNLVPVVAEIDRSLDCPKTSSWEYLNARDWKFPIPLSAVIADQQKYEELAEEVCTAIENGCTVHSLALKHRVNDKTIKDALSFARTGERPKSAPTGKKTGKKRDGLKTEAIADEVVHRVEVLKQSMSRIAKALGVSANTVQRAYFQRRPQEIGRVFSNSNKSAEDWQMSEIVDGVVETCRSNHGNR